jgi:hypothetical protein
VVGDRAAVETFLRLREEERTGLIAWLAETTGDVASVHDRLSEIVDRYGPHDVVTRFIRRAEPQLVSSVVRTGQRLFLAQ